MAESSGNKAKTVVLVVAMMFFGSFNTINTKLQFQTCAPSANDSDGQCRAGWHLFNKPWTQTYAMFVGEATVLLVYGFQKRQRKRRRARMLAAAAGSPAALEAAASNGSPSAGARAPSNWIFAIPASCDVFGTGLAAVGLQWVDSAIWQMLRSALIPFSAVLSRGFLKRQLQPFHWVATLIVTMGLALVGVASMLDATKSLNVTVSQRLLGMALVVIAQLMAAFQMVFEELLLTGAAKVSAKKVVGMEGTFGCCFLTVALFVMYMIPGPDAGHFESFPDAVRMCAGSPALLALVLSYVASIPTYNVVGITVGKKMGTVIRCLVDSCRTVTVWAVNLYLHYYVSDSLGAAWTPHSWVTVIGFFVLAFGTLLYNEVIPAPAFLRDASAGGSASAGGLLQGEVGHESPLVGTVDKVLSFTRLTDEDEEDASSDNGARASGISMSAAR
eukprot:TRINITY_DN25663_c0_g4_i1.p1 TRINITY_DN25663_c0_g4~~TRINITY_DN25663_c0_g4_i1.p1  ORF type:complete len:444 (-),score=94.16 TRINITY_DN25663_c0_g4_i1:85-1416(-)